MAADWKQYALQIEAAPAGEEVEIPVPPGYGMLATAHGVRTSCRWRNFLVAIRMNWDDRKIYVRRKGACGR